MRIIGVVIALGAWLFLVSDYVTEFYAVDFCLDAGHVYDYAKSACNEEAEHLPYVSYVDRKGELIVLAALGVLVGLVVMSAGKGKKL